MEEKSKEIYGLLRKVCSFGTRKPKYVKDLMKYLTGTDEWEYEDGLNFYEFILRHYLDDEKAERMIVVSGIPDKYRSMTTIRERREAYTKSLRIYSDLDTYRKQEEPILTYLANRLLSDIENNRLPKLIERWRTKTAEDQEPLSETQSSPVESEAQNASVQPEIHISNDGNVSPTINNTMPNDNNITEQTDGIYPETSVFPAPIGSSGSNEERKTSELLTDKKRNGIILLIVLLFIIGLWLIFSKIMLPSVDDSFVSEKAVSLGPGEIYEIKTAAFSEGTPDPILNFTSSDPSIAKVSEKGIVVAQDKPGTCEIVVQAKSGKVSKLLVFVSETKKGISVPEIGDGGEYISGINLNTKVRNTRKTDNDWEDTVDAAVGDIVEFLIECSVLSNENLNDIVVRDVLPQYMEYIPGTIRLYNQEHEDGIYLEQDTITTEGIHIAPYQTNEKISFRFAAKIFNVDSSSTPVLLANETQVWNEAKKETLLKDYSYIEARFWGPERPTYTMNQPVDHATFNSITDNSAIGDERDFVRIAEKREDGLAVYSNDVILEAGKQYEVYIYFHNNASATYNDSTHDNVGISWNTRLSCDFPNRLETGQRAAIVGRITSTSTEPEMIWDAANITASQNMTLHFMPATAKIYSDPKWATNGAVLSSNLFSQKGTFLGLLSLDGTIPGCDEYSGYVVYTIQTYVADNIN